MYKNKIYYENSTGRTLGRRCLSLTDLIASVVLFTFGALLFLKAKEYFISAVLIFAGVCELVKCLTGTWHAACPCCSKSLQVRQYRNDSVLICHECRSFLYRKNDSIYLLKLDKESVRVKALPRKLFLCICYAFFLVVIAGLILLKAGVNYGSVNILYYCAGVPFLCFLLVSIVLEYLQKKNIEVEEWSSDTGR